MGKIFEYKCGQCEYTASVSGGRGVGMTAVVQTMICLDCKELVDVLIGRFGIDGPTGDPDFDNDLNLCPECRGSQVRPWSKKRPCPRCGERMSKPDNGLITLWD